MLADAAYWLMHDDVNGSLQTSKRAADTVIAAAVLAELIDAGALRLGFEQVLVHTAPSLDDLGQAVLAQIVAVPELSPAEVLDGLAPGVRKRVADRLVESGQADWARSGLFRRVAVARAGDLGPAWVRTDLSTRVERNRGLSEPERFLLRLLQHSTMAGNPLAGIDARWVQQVLWPTERAVDPYHHLLEIATVALRHTAMTR